VGLTQNASAKCNLALVARQKHLMFPAFGEIFNTASGILNTIRRLISSRTRKAAVGNIRQRLSWWELSLCHSQRFQGRLVNCSRFIKSVITLIIRDCLTRERSNETVHLAVIITLLL
jgi:hypothetical protein